MAVIGRIRKHSTLLLIIVGVAILAFLVGDALTNRTSSQRQNIFDKMIKVGSDYISWQAFDNAYNIRRQMAKENNQGAELSGEQDFQLGNELYNELVDSLLYAKQAAKLGIVVTDEEIADMMISDMPHQYAQQFFNQGQGYDMNLARNFIENLNNYPDTNIIKYYLRMEDAVRKETIQKKYQNLLSGAYYLPKAFAQKMADEQKLRADIVGIQLPYSLSMVSDDKVTFTQEDVEKWYQEHKYRFPQEEEFRNVDYVIFDIQPSAADLQKIADTVNARYNAFLQSEDPDIFVNRMPDSRYDSTYFKRGALPVPALDSVVFNAPINTFIPPFVDGNFWVFAKLLDAKHRPDSVCISVISILDKGLQESPRSEEVSAARLDSAFNLVKSGADFYQTALQFSDDKVDQMPDSASLWLIDGTTEAAIYQKWFDTLYNFPVGSIIKQKETGVTFIFKVKAVTSFEKKVQLAIGKVAIEASSATIESIETAANNFANGLSNAKEFDDKVTKSGLNKRTFERVQLMSYNLPGVNGNGREIIKWIYDKEREKGDVSEVYMMEGMNVVVCVKDIYPKGYVPLSNEQIKNYVETMVKRDKKAQKLETLVKPLLNKDLTTITADLKTETDSFRVDTFSVTFADRNLSYFGPEMKVIGQIFSHDAATKNVLYKGDMGVYVLKINKIEVPTVTFNEQSITQTEGIMQQGKSSYARTVQSATTRTLKKMTEIEDNRYMFY
ncbi:MAG: SurA N-terminal domain-containing protein [Bacteroidales bacterium]|nr:SurA N-terminal domain-containing protein [Bacteroidales bacterium]